MDTTKSTYPRFFGSAPTPDPIKKTSPSERPFGRRNFIFMAASLALIVIGFLLMTGPGSGAETGFNPDIFSTRRIIVGPTIAFLGFLSMAFAIIINPSRNKKS